MAIFTGTSNANKKASPSFAADVPLKDLVDDANKPADFEPAQPPQVFAAQSARTPAASSSKESVIASDLSIEGKIQGAGHVRIAGKFTGEVQVEGNLTIEQGAKLAGGVHANQVNIAGELDGNIEQASKVELQSSSVVNGDIKAETLTVLAGARIRGHVDCGPDHAGQKSAARKDGA